MTINDPSKATPRAGARTSEFWLNILAMLLSALFAADVIPTSGVAAKLAIVAAIMLTSLGYTVSRTRVKTGASTLLVLVLGLGLVPHSMACTASTRAKTMTVALATADGAQAAFVAYDALKQDSIVSDATSFEEGERALSAWRVKQTHARTLLANVYRAIAVAKILDDDASIASALQALVILKDALVTMGVKL